MGRYQSRFFPLSSLNRYRRWFTICPLIILSAAGLLVSGCRNDLPESATGSAPDHLIGNATEDGCTYYNGPNLTFDTFSAKLVEESTTAARRQFPDLTDADLVIRNNLALADLQEPDSETGRTVAQVIATIPAEAMSQYSKWYCDEPKYRPSLRGAGANDRTDNASVQAAQMYLDFPFSRIRDALTWCTFGTDSWKRKNSWDPSVPDEREAFERDAAISEAITRYMCHE